MNSTLTFRRKVWRTDPTGRIGAAIMAGFGAIAAFRWQSSGFAFFGMMVIRDFAGAWFLLNRHPNEPARSAEESGARRIRSIVAYVSSALPLLYFTPLPGTVQWRLTTVSVLTLIGFALSTFAMLDLGRSFGVSPANRVRVTSGVYAFMNHPMYTGYVIAELGMCIGNFWNLPIATLALGLYVVRGKWELCR